jgi:glycine cleavage system transcriptional repressor
MPQFVISVFGADRPGIIAEVTGALAAVGANLEDSTMSVLRGRLAMMIVASAQASEQQLQQAVQGLDTAHLQVSARLLEQLDHAEETPAQRYILSVHGADQLGIVSAITGVMAAAGGNITDLSTRLLPPGQPGGDPLYVLVADVDLPAQADPQQVDRELAARAEQLGVQASLRPAEPDLL